MNKIVFAILLLGLDFHLSAQRIEQERIDSLILKLSKSQDDSSKANTLNYLSEHLKLTGNYLQAKKYADEELELSKKINYKTGIANSFISIAKIYRRQGNYPVALKNDLEALKIAEEIGYKKGMGDAYNHIGNVYLDQGSYSEAFKNYSVAFKIRQEINDKRGIADAESNIGDAYRLQGKYKEAFNNYSASFAKYKELDDKQRIAAMFWEIGINFYSQGIYRKALENFFSSLKISKEINDKEQVALAYNSVGNTFTKQNKYHDALINLDEGLKIAKEIGEKKVEKESYQGLMNVYEMTKDYKNEIIFYKLFVDMKDSIFNVETSAKIANLQYQYQTEKEEKIRRLEDDKKTEAAKADQDKKDALAKAEIKRQTLIKNSTLGGVGIAGIFSFLLVRSFTRRRKTSFEKQVSEVETKALRSQMNPHFIFNSLNSIDDYMRRNDTKNSSLFLNKFSKLMRMILESSRNDEVSIKEDIESLELYIQLENIGMKNKVEWTIAIDPEINVEQTMIPPLLLQPFVENSFKHAFHGIAEPKLEIKISLKDNLLLCSVTDNGKGRNKIQEVTAETNEKRKSLGMTVTKERLDIISKIKKSKAFMSFEDLKDSYQQAAGTKVELTVPASYAF